MFNDDDKFLGATSFNKFINLATTLATIPASSANNWPMVFYVLLGVPWLNRRYIVVYVNGQRRGSLMEDAQNAGQRRGEGEFPER